MKTVQTDSLNIRQDTAISTVVEETAIVEQAPARPRATQPVVVQTAVPASTQQVNEEFSAVDTQAVNTSKPDSVVAEAHSPIHLFTNLRKKDSAQIQIAPITLQQFEARGNNETIVQATPRNYARVFEKEWVFGTAILATLLIIVVRLFYQKHFQITINSLFNLQLAEKVLKEKNTINRRSNLLLNICFVLGVSLLSYVTVERLELVLPANNSFLRFGLIALIVSSVMLLRVIITALTAGLFDSIAVFKEYLHNSLLVYKNMGLYLLPLMLSYFYVSTTIGNVIYTSALVLLCCTFVVRYFKAVQIIIKHNVFLFYSILYLCTLEILPTLIGIKFVLTLI